MCLFVFLVCRYVIAFSHCLCFLCYGEVLCFVCGGCETANCFIFLVYLTELNAGIIN
jgi:hypothetical protein